MIPTPRWPVLALAVALAACGGGGGGGGGAGAGTAIDCSWLTGANCYKASAAAARACTNAGLTGTFNVGTTLCTYSDGVTVHFDPASPATVAYENFGPWDFTVLTSTATTCARYVDTSDSSWTLTTSLGTFSADWTTDPITFTCPDGSRFSLPGATALTCVSDFPGWFASRGGDTLSFGLFTPPSSSTLWRCR